MLLKFNDWVKKYGKKQGGVRKLSKDLGVGEHTTRTWLRGENAPKSETILEIIKLSKGELTFEIILKETTRNK